MKKYEKYSPPNDLKSYPFDYSGNEDKDSAGL